VLNFIAATIDDISVFVIPILPYKLEHEVYLDSKKRRAESGPSLVVENGEEAIGSLQAVQNGIGIFNEEETVEYEPKARMNTETAIMKPELPNSEDNKQEEPTSGTVPPEAPISDVSATEIPKNENEDDSSH